MNDIDKKYRTSLLIGKVARGVNLPVSESQRSIYKSDGFSENRTEWEGEAPGILPKERLSVPGDENFQLEQGSREEIPEFESPSKILKTDNPLEHKRDEQHNLNHKNKDNINGGKDSFVQDVITEDTQGNAGISENLISREEGADGKGFEEGKSVKTTIHNSQTEQGNNLDSKINNSHLNNTKSWVENPENKESDQDSKNSISEKSSDQRRAIDSKKGSFQHLNAEDFHPTMKNIEQDVLKPIFPESKIKEQNKNDFLTENPTRLNNERDSFIKGKLPDDYREISKEAKKNTNSIDKVMGKRAISNKSFLPNLDTGLNDKSIRSPDHNEDKRVPGNEAKSQKKKKRFIKSNFSEIKKTTVRNIAANNEKDSSVIKKIQNREKGSIKVGRININVRGRGKVEEDQWPEAPLYTDHILTEDWEWSCLYGRQE